MPAFNTDVFVHRSSLANSRIIFETTRKGRVSFIGGSITQAFVSGTDKAWRDHAMDILSKRFPETKFDFVNAGVGGTNSTLGAFRFEEDVFANGPVDLLFIEFAVNDGGGAVGDLGRMRAMEGIIRHARHLNPKIDIIIQYLIAQNMMDDINAGKFPPVIIDHEKVAEYYQIPVINQAVDVTHRINAKQFAWEAFGQDVAHPTVFGHSVYGENIQKFLDQAWEKPIPANAKPIRHPLPQPFDAANLEKGHLVPLEDVEIGQGFNIQKGFLPEKTCNFYRPYDILTAQNAGDWVELKFEGNEVGIYYFIGFDTGIIEYSVDEGETQSLDLFDGLGKVFYRPACQVLAQGLTPGKHVVRLKMSDKKNPESTGHAIHMVGFCVN